MEGLNFEDEKPTEDPVVQEKVKAASAEEQAKRAKEELEKELGRSVTDEEAEAAMEAARKRQETRPYNP